MIKVLFENLGNIDGYYNIVNNQTFIHINNQLRDELQEVIFLRELYFLSTYKYNVHALKTLPKVDLFQILAWFNANYG